MNGYPNINGLTSSTQRQHAHPTNSMPITNGSSHLAHKLMNPRAAQMANGTPSTSTSTSLPAMTQFQRASSEPSHTCSHQTPSASSFPTSLSNLNEATQQNLTSEGQPRSKKASSLNGDFVRPQSHFDPRALLNPKGYAQRPTSPEKQDGTTIPEKSHTKRLWSESQDASQGQPKSTSLNPRYNTEVTGQGMGNFIERLHNVSKREEHPSKKQKRENDAVVNGEEKSTFGGGSKDGFLGQYVKNRTEEGKMEAGTASAIVDLTGDDEEIAVVSDTADKVVCYGRVEGARVQAHKVPSPNPNAKSLSKTTWPMIKVELKHLHANNHIISVTDPCGNDFGNVDVRTAQALVPLMNSKSASIRLQARVTPRPKNGQESPGQPMSGTFDLNINVYGKQKEAVMIGRLFSQKQVWLRTPLLVDSGIETFNPHVPKAGVPSKPASSSAGASGVGGGFVSRTVEEIRSDVMGMFDSLEKSETLPEMTPDPRVITPLLTHQKQALFFMMKKEEGRIYSMEEEDKKSLWRLHQRPNGQRMYYNVITGQEERRKPPDVLGGILADMMGLGKTLSILSLIVSTLDDSQIWADEKPPPTPQDIPLLRNSKTTLLVSPLSTMANWEEQIKTHIEPGTLNYHVYHGSNRCTDVDELAKYDLIITTYSIVSSEFLKQQKNGGKNPLLQTNWFRIVLDEAHMIREQSTRQSKAICSLRAQRRWAVTGTPIQNRLDDLGALIKFLRIQPFDEKGGFKQFILSPFKMADPEILPKLRLLVDSITLRRLKDRIDLPARHDLLVRLQFSDQERSLYDWFAKEADSKVKAVIGDKKKLGGKAYVHILRSILRLRLLCAHGKELLSEEDIKMTEGFSMNNAIDLEDEDDEKPALPPKQAYDMLNLLKESGADSCAQCQRKIGPKDQPTEDAPTDKDETIGYMTPCYQILCIHCISAFKETVQQNATADHHVVCPLCEQYIRVSYFELKQGKVDEDEEARLMAKDNPRLAKQMGRYSGPHTKTRALIAALLESQADSIMNPDERPIKSVIFSGWTSHLDLIQIALEDNNIPYVRLDGKMSRVKRNASLDAFRDDPSVTVILVSIMAGGLGLNLTTANKVYVMEPQFNPAAEAQAIDRVHRLGQTREVTATRFIMDESFEEKMLELQKKKQNLADLSMNRGKLDRSESAKQKLEELRSLFR